jgi:hypothetical protein
MIRLETVPTMPQRKIQGVDLTPAQYAEFVAAAGRERSLVFGSCLQPCAPQS